MDNNKTTNTMMRSLSKSMTKYRVFGLTTLSLTISLTFAWIVFAESYGTNLGSFDGVTVYSNGTPNYASYNDNYVGNVRIGMKWQCVEYVRRYYYLKYGIDLRSRHVGHAKTFWDAASKMGLDRYGNGSSTSPQRGDMIVSTSGLYGHIAIIRDVIGNQVHVAQQNFFENASDVDYTLTLNTSNGNYSVGGFSSGLPVRGWLRRQGTTVPTCPAGTSENFRPNGYSPIHPSGTLIKLASDPTFYLIRDGQKQGISSQAVLEYLYDNGGFRFEDVITVAQDEFSSYPTIGEAITSELPSNGRLKADGTLIRKANGQVSIVADNGNRRPFDTYQTFINLGYKDCNFINVSDEEYNSYPAGNSVDAMPKLTASMRLYDISYVGQPIRGEFTITNVGTSPYTFDKLLISGRLNNTTITDFPYVSSITLNPGQSYSYSKTFTPTSAGSYRFYVAYQEPNGHWTTSVPANNGIIRSETIQINNSQPQITTTVGTNPAGGSFTVDGTTYTTTQTFSNWTSGASHTIGTAATQTSGLTRWVWSNWSDGGAVSHTVSPTSNTTYTAGFTTQHYLTTTAGTGGTVSSQSNWYNQGQSVQVTAIPNSGYAFSGWTGSGSGSYSGANNPASVTVNSPITQTANFTQNPTTISVTVGTNPAGGSFVVDGTTYTANRSFDWTSGSSHSIGTTTPQADGNTRYNWSDWSDGGAITHNVSPMANTTYTANFTTQYYLTMNAGVGGNISPQSGWFNAGQSIPISAAPNSGYTFSSWSGSGSGSYNGASSSATVTMNGSVIQTASFLTNTTTRKTKFDYDGDGKADVSIYRPSEGNWYISNSGAGGAASVTRFGLGSDKLVPADYDGDGKTDVAVYRPSEGNWYLLRSSAGFGGVHFGLAEDIPIPADFDGDGKSELAVYRPSSGVWYVFNLVNSSFTGVQFGTSTDKPVAADYDGDGKADYAIYRPSEGNWYLQQSTAGFNVVRFGLADDKPVTGDYDGDGKADEAIYRPSEGNWYLQRSSIGFGGAHFGAATDIPVEADYDGDGKTDLAVYRPAEGVWYQLNTRSGFQVVGFGISTDKPTPNAFVP